MLGGKKLIAVQTETKAQGKNDQGRRVAEISCDFLYFSLWLPFRPRCISVYPNGSWLGRVSIDRLCILQRTTHTHRKRDLCVSCTQTYTHGWQTPSTCLTRITDLFPSFFAADLLKTETNGFCCVFQLARPLSEPRLPVIWRHIQTDGRSRPTGQTLTISTIDWFNDFQ